MKISAQCSMLSLQITLVVILAGLLSQFSGNYSLPSETPSTFQLSTFNFPTSTFSTNIKVNKLNLGYQYQVEPTMVIDEQGRIFVGWKEATTATGPGYRVGFAYSLDGGDTWSDNILMETNVTGNRQSDPWLAIDKNGTLYYSFIEYNFSASNSGEGVQVARSYDHGLNWERPVKASDTPNFADKESMTVDIYGNIYIAYDDVGNSVDTRVVKSVNGAQSFLPSVRVPDNVGDFVGPYVITDKNGTVYVTWFNYSDSNIYFDKSENGGQSFGTDIRVNDIPGRAHSDGNWLISLPSMAIDSKNRIYTAWVDNRSGNPDIYITSSTDKGLTWANGTRINDDTTTNKQWMVDIAVDSQDVVHAAWVDNRTGNLNIYYANSTDGGKNFGPNLKVTTAETPSSYIRPGDYLSLRIDKNDNVYIVWTDGRDTDTDIYFARLNKTGQQQNSAPNTPATPSGISTGKVNVSYNFTTSTTDPENDNVKYVFDWGDNTNSTSSFISSGSTVSLAHSWSKNGIYNVKVQAIDIYGAASQWSQSLMVTITDAPLQPQIQGPTYGLTNGSYEFKLNSTDPDNDNVKYFVDWNDGTNYTTGYYPSGVAVNVNHSWSQVGIYIFQARAIDSSGFESQPAYWTINITQDRTPPTINHTPITFAPSGISVTINAKITDDSSVNFAVLFYRKIGTQNYSSTLMSLLSEDNYSAIINSTIVQSPGLQYYIFAGDIYNNTAIFPLNGLNAPLTITISYAPRAPQIDGPSHGVTNFSYNFSIRAIDPNNDTIKYTLLWNDDTNTTTGFNPSGVSITVEHSWSSPGTFVITLKATDIYGLDSIPASWTINISDDKIPPSIQHTPINVSPAGKSISIYANVTDNSSVKSVFLYYRKSGTQNWTQLVMSSVSQNAYNAMIPGAEVQPPELEYYISASDIYNNSVTFPVDGFDHPLKITIKSDEVVIYGLSGVEIIGFLIVVMMIFAISRRKLE